MIELIDIELGEREDVVACLFRMDEDLQSFKFVVLRDPVTCLTFDESFEPILERISVKSQEFVKAVLNYLEGRNVELPMRLDSA